MTVSRGLLAPDPALPLRDELLDGDAVARRLPELLGVPDGTPVGPVARVRVKYQPGRSLRVTSRFSMDGREHLLSSRMVTAERWPRLLAATGEAPAEAGVRTVVADPRRSTVSWLFPRDRRLGSLGAAWARTPAVRAAVGARWATSRLAGYAPEKTATLRCLDADGRPLGYVKVYGTADAARDAARRATAAATGARVPRVTAVVPELCLLVLEAVDGRRLDELPAAALPDAVAALGAALAALHRVPAGGLPPLARFTAESLQSSADLVARARPDVGALASDVASALAGAATFAGSTLVHADPRLPNALLTGGTVALVDLDSAAAGHPAADVAGVLAGFRRARLVGLLEPGEEARLGRRLLDGYARGGGTVDRSALRWHLAAGLLTEGAARAVARVSEPVLRRLDLVLAEALDLVGAGPPTDRADAALGATGAAR